MSSGMRLWAYIDDEIKFQYISSVGIRKVINRDGSTFVYAHELILGDSFINGFKNGTCLEVHHGECGDPRIYEEEKIIMKFLNCELVESRIDNITSMSPVDIGALEIDAVFECDALGRFGGKDSEFIPFDSRGVMKNCISCGQMYSRLRFEGGCPSCGSPQEKKNG